MNFPLSAGSLSADILGRCSECGACVRNCGFLSRHGTPKAIAAAGDLNDPQWRLIAYQCSQCGLCRAVCPEGLDPCMLFMEIRRHHVGCGTFDPGPYRAILGYEAVGRSRLFSCCRLPDGCDTVFFPGCTLPGTRAAVTWSVFRELRKGIPSLGMVLACCAKPSHDLGRTSHFRQAFGEVLARLTAGGVRTVLTACPNCTRMFSQYGDGLSVRTVYEILHERGLAAPVVASGLAVSVHDPCPMRDHLQAQAAVRGLLMESGYAQVEMPHRKKTALCCGEGGSVGCVDHALSEGWAEKRLKEACGRLLVTYCAGCAGFLRRATPTIHILDLLFRADGADHHVPAVAGGLATYCHRLLLKLRLLLEGVRQ